MAFGSDRGRFTEGKRSVHDKNIGPLVKTVMTRCIHCTRCVRFASEVAGVPELGITGRGNASEVGTYVERAMSSELAGNVIDLCPVGALTSKPYAFTARQWELKGTESVDVSDGLGANVRIDARGPEVMRVVPLLNDDVNEEWLSDKGRFAYDGLRSQRLVQPLVRGPDGTLQPATWQAALAAAAAALKAADPSAIRAVAGKLADVEAATALKDLWSRLGSGDTRYERADALDVSSRGAYTFGGGPPAIDGADAILLVGTNPRTDAAVLNARLRRAWLAGTPIGLVGPAALAAPGNPATGAPLTYPVSHVGEGPDALAGLMGGGKGGKGGEFASTLKSASRPLIIVGSAVAARPDGAAILAAAHELAASVGAVATAPGEWDGWAVLHTDAGRVGAADIGFTPSVSAAEAEAAGARPKLVYLLHADDWSPGTVPDGAFVIYQGSHGDAGAGRADIVLPGSAYTEKDGTYVNTAGRAQATRAAVPRPGDAREDWAIVRALAEVAGVRLPYDDRRGVRARAAQLAPHLANPGSAPTPLPGLAGTALAAAAARSAPLDARTPLPAGPANFYQTDVISRASVVMAKATAARRASAAEDEGGALAA
jgi:NADH dehydrogenase (ubiquinone) Fe-S protein 1